MKIFKINAIATALTPITHMMGSKGNESLINRESIFENGKVVQVPYLSGNSIRHKMIREPGAIDLIKQCDMIGKLSIEQLNFMMNGGSLTESSVSTNIQKIYNLQKLLPLFRLLGGSLKNQIISGSLNNSFGFLFCKENKERIAKLLNNNEIIDKFKFNSYEHFISNYQYTRSSAKNVKNYERFLKQDEPENENLMIYNGQTLIAGSVFLIQFNLVNCDDIELGALLNALSCYIDSGCIIGGMGRIGHGKIDIELLNDEYDFDSLIETYRDHNDINSNLIYNWLQESFPCKALNTVEPKQKTKKGKKDVEELETNDLFAY